MKKAILILSLVAYSTNCLAFIDKDFKNMYTLVNGMLISPSASARTIGKNVLRAGISGYYYLYKEKQNGLMYFPLDYRIGEDAFINFTIEYGIFNNSEISILIPHSPDWQSDRGGNKQGIADIAILFKQYLLSYYDTDLGFNVCYKLNSSTYADNPQWYGTNYSNIMLKLIVSRRYKNLNSFINIGYKDVLGSGKIYSEKYNIYFTYANTFVGAVGFRFQPMKLFELSFESNYESHNKTEISGYYLDICGGIIFNLPKNIQLYGNAGRYLSKQAPSLYLSAGMLISMKM